MRLSDAFEIRITVLDDLDQIGSVAANELNVFRVVELDLTSKVQACWTLTRRRYFPCGSRLTKAMPSSPSALRQP